MKRTQFLPVHFTSNLEEKINMKCSSSPFYAKLCLFMGLNFDEWIKFLSQFHLVSFSLLGAYFSQRV